MSAFGSTGFGSTGFDGAAADATTAADLRARGSLKWSVREGAIGAWVAESDFGTAPEVRAALTDPLLGYPTHALFDAAAAAAAGFLRRRHGWSVDPARIRPIGDVIAGLTAMLTGPTGLTPPHGRVVVPTPAYMPFLTVPAACGREAVEVPLTRDGGRWVYDLDALAAVLRTDDVLLLCNPHNPVGRVLTEPELRGIAAVVEVAGARVFSDEIHAPLVLPGHRHVPYASLTPATAAHTVTATSASKAWNLAGLKCAQLILTSEADAERWERAGELAEHGASTPGLAATVAAYSAGEEWLDGQLAYLDGNATRLGDLLAEGLPQVGWSRPEGTYLSLLDLRPLERSDRWGDAPAAWLAEHAGVVTVEGRLCGAVATGFVRYNLATPRPILTETVARLVRACAS